MEVKIEGDKEQNSKIFINDQDFNETMPLFSMMYCDVPLQSEESSLWLQNIEIIPSSEDSANHTIAFGNSKTYKEKYGLNSSFNVKFDYVTTPDANISECGHVSINNSRIGDLNIEDSKDLTIQTVQANSAYIDNLDFVNISGLRANNDIYIDNIDLLSGELLQTSAKVAISNINKVFSLESSDIKSISLINIGAKLSKMSNSIIRGDISVMNCTGTEVSNIELPEQDITINGLKINFPNDKNVKLKNGYAIDADGRIYNTGIIQSYSLRRVDSKLPKYRFKQEERNE